MATRCATVLGLLVLAGCGGDNQPPFPDLHPVKGVVKRGGQPVSGGGIRFDPDPARPEFIITSTVEPDGTFTLATIRTTDKSGERKPGAPAGKYKVTYMPPAGDQTAGGASFDPITAPGGVTVEAKENDLTVELTKR